jgi:hypothetical protein
LNVRHEITAKAQFIAKGFGKSKRSGTKKEGFSSDWYRSERSINVIERDSRIRCHCLDPSFSDSPILDSEVRRLIWLRHQQSLFSEARKKMGFPKPRVKAFGLRIADPISVRPRQG